MAAARVSGFRSLSLHSRDDVWMRMAEQHRPVAGPVIDELVAIDVPLPRAALAIDIDRERLHVTQIVRDAGRKHGASVLVATSGAGKLGAIAFEYGHAKKSLMGVGHLTNRFVLRSPFRGGPCPTQARP